MAVLYHKDNEKGKQIDKSKIMQRKQNLESMLVSSSKYIDHKNKAAKQVKETAKSFLKMQKGAKCKISQNNAKFSEMTE